MSCRWSWLWLFLLLRALRRRRRRRQWAIVVGVDDDGDVDDGCVGVANLNGVGCCPRTGVHVVVVLWGCCGRAFGSVVQTIFDSNEN